MKTEAEAEMCRIRSVQFATFGKKCPKEKGFETAEPMGQQSNPSATTIQIQKKKTYDDLVREGKEEWLNKEHSQWRIGDLALEIRKYKRGEEGLKEYAKDVNPEYDIYETLKRYRRVSSKYEFGTRALRRRRNCPSTSRTMNMP